MYEEHLDPLKRQLVDTTRSELDLMSQWGVLGEVIPAEIDDTRDCTKPAEKEGDKKEKINVTFSDYDEDDVEDYGNGELLTCFKNRLPEYLQNDENNENLELDDENDSIPELEFVTNMPNLNDHDYEAVEGFYNQQLSISNNFNEITISDLSLAFTNSSIQYNHPGYSLFSDGRKVITSDMDDNDKIRMIFHRDYHRRNLYLNLRKQ